MDQQKDCCKDPANHAIYWQLNIYEDWEPAATYCKCCKQILEEHIVIGRNNGGGL